MFDRLFSSLEVNGLTLANRMVMAPLYLGYAGLWGSVSPLLLEHCRLMGQSGAAMITVENATVDHPLGSGSNRTIRADADEHLQGLTELAEVIKEQGALACLQVNHAGRFSCADKPVAPSAVDTFGRVPAPLSRENDASCPERLCRCRQPVPKVRF